MGPVLIKTLAGREIAVPAVVIRGISGCAIILEIHGRQPPLARSVM